MVAGKRYVFFRLANGGLRSRKVAIYSNPSIGALVSYFILHGAELPLLGLTAVWVLGLVTSLAVDNSWGFGTASLSMILEIPFGSFDAAMVSQSFPWVTIAGAQLGYVQSSSCLGLEQKLRLINVTSTSITTDVPSGIIYYPPLPGLPPDTSFSFSTALNGFDVTVESLSSVPPTAQSLDCFRVGSALIDDLHLWFGGSNNQTLSIIAARPTEQFEPATDGNGFNFYTNISRFNATAIIMAGTLSSEGNYVEFSRSGGSWPNVMSEGQWAEDITSLMCNTTIPPLGSCVYSSLIGFAATLNNKPRVDGDTFYSALNMALGAYSFAMYSYFGNTTTVQGTQHDGKFVTQYGIYILILHIVASLVMLVVAVGLRMANPLGTDFIHSTRLLLDPLKKPELFNASLETTLDALEDPYMMVSGTEFLIMKQKAMRGRGERGEGRGEKGEKR